MSSKKKIFAKKQAKKSAKKTVQKKSAKVLKKSSFFSKKKYLSKKKPGPVAKKRKKPVRKVSAKISKEKFYPAKTSYFSKSLANPIISPRAHNGWECWQTFNPGVILLGNKVHFIYRAIGHDGISRFGYAMSENGFKINERLPYSIFKHYIKERVFNIISYFSGGSWGGAEDPRIVRVGREDVLHMTYTAVGDGELRVALTSIGVNDFLNKKWRWKSPVFISPPGEIHKNWVIFPEKINGKYAILHSLNPKISIDYRDSLDFDGSNYIKSFYGRETDKNCWDSLIKGAGAPPIKTESGWLLFYHAIDKNDSNKYKVGAMLLDLKDPSKVLLRSKTPILEPTEVYENNGYKSGVIYASGAIKKNKELLVYYGGADSFVCVAHADLKTFLKALMKEEKPKLVKEKIKKSS